jgi:hypothetical protein
VPILGIAQQQIHRLPNELVGREAELARGRWIGELDRTGRVERQDGIRRTPDHGVVAGVLALAQDALAARRYGDVDNLQEASESRPAADRADRDIVQQVLARGRSQREDLRMKRVREQAGRAELQRLGDRRRQPGWDVAGKELVEPPADCRVRRHAAGSSHPGVPSDDPALCVERYEADIDRIENGTGDRLTRCHSMAASHSPYSR